MKAQNLNRRQAHWLISEKGENLVEVLNYSNWITFSRNTVGDQDPPRVVLYINIRLSQFCFSLRNDIFNHRNISCISFFNYGSIFYVINVYSDSSQTALKYLKNTEATINNILIMTEDFNIRNSICDLNFLYYSTYSNLLTNIADSMNLCLLRPTNPVPTRYLDNWNDSNLTINLIFLRQDSLEFDNHIIHPDWRLLLDHTSLTVSIIIIKDYIQTRKYILVKNSKEEEKFIKELSKLIAKCCGNH